MTAKDPVDSLYETLELLERHISMLRTVKENQPVGLIRLSEMTGIPKHKVRYSLKIMEQQGIIVATPDGATVSDGYEEFMKEMAESVEDLAEKVIADDDTVDAYFDKVKQALIRRIADDPAEGGTALDLLMIAKYLERIGDHATNIAEWVEFSVTGVHKEE